MQLIINLRSGEHVEVSSFKEFTVAFHELNTYKADQISSVALTDRATYVFKGENTVMLSGKDILYLEIN